MVTGVRSLEKRESFIVFRDMASYQMFPPKNFNLSQPEEWSEYTFPRPKSENDCVACLFLILIKYLNEKNIGSSSSSDFVRHLG